MSDPLSSSRAKLARSREQLDTLHKEVTDYAATRPYEIRTDFNPETGLYVGRVYSNERPSISGDVKTQWSLLAAEAAANMRTALDQLVYALSNHARADGVSPDDVGVRTQFPIFTTTDNYFKGKRHRARMLAGVSEANRAKIDRLQPFQRTLFADRDPLVVLDWLTNKDKHRISHVTFVAVTGEDVHLHLDFGEEVAEHTVDIISMRERNSVWEIEDGAEVYRFTAHDSSGQPEKAEVTVDFRFYVEPAFGERRITVERLNVVHGHVKSIVDDFIPAFGT